MEETPIETTEPKVTGPPQKGPSGLVRLSILISFGILGVAALYFLGVHDACTCGFTAIDFEWALGIFVCGIIATFASIELNVAKGRSAGLSLVIAFVGLVFCLVFAIGVTLQDGHPIHPDTGTSGPDTRLIQLP